MAQIRSKQIADFLSAVNWGAVNTTDIANAADIKSYVDGKIGTEHAHHIAEKVELDSSIDSLESKGVADLAEINSSVDSLEIALDDEITNRIADVDAEEARAIAAEGSLNTKVTDETTRATAAEGTLTTNLATEVSRAIAAEGVLQGNINTEKGRIDAILNGSTVDLDQFAEVIAYVDSLDSADDNFLVNKLTSSDLRLSGLDTALAAEITATNNDVTAINLSVDSLEGKISTDISAEKLRAEAAEGVLTTNLATESGRAIAAEGVLTSNLSTLSTEVVNEVQSIDTRLGSVSGNLVDSVDSLELALSTEISATNADVTAINASVDSLEIKLSSEDSIEKARALAAEGVLSTNLAAEINTTNGEINAINASVDSLEIKLSSEDSIEKARALAAEGTLTTNLATEVSRATAAEGVLQGNINTEKGRIDAILAGSVADLDQFAEVITYLNSIDSVNDLDLTNHIATADAHFGRLDDSVDSLESEISSEISSARDFTNYVYDYLTAEVSVEATTREIADTTLQANITQGDTYTEEKVVNLNAVKNSDLTFNTLTNFMTAPYDMELYVNGIRVDFDQLGANEFKLNLPYDIDATDIVKVYGIPVIAAPGAVVWYPMAEDTRHNGGTIGDFSAHPNDGMGQSYDSAYVLAYPFNDPTWVLPEPGSVQIGDIVTVERADGSIFTFEITTLTENSAIKFEATGFALTDSDPDAMDTGNYVVTAEWRYSISRP